MHMQVVTNQRKPAVSIIEQHPLQPNELLREKTELVKD